MKISSFFVACFFVSNIFFTTPVFALDGNEAIKPEKGIEFTHPQGEGNLIVVENIRQMRILSNLNIPKALFTVLINRTNEASSIYSSNPNMKYTLDLYKIIYRINEESGLEVSTEGSDQNIDFIVTGLEKDLEELKSMIVSDFESDDSLKYLKSIVSNPRGDRWFQDWGEFVGYGTNDNGDMKYGIYYVKRNRKLWPIVQEVARMTAMPFITTSSEESGRNGGNYGGNIETTPDGIVFVGNTMDPIQVKQLEEYGNKMLMLDTSWLQVGHVDEMFSIIPSNSKCNYSSKYRGPRVNYSIVTADPIKALNMALNYQEEEDEYRATLAPTKLPPL